jgi:hypothetical protein
MSTAMPSSTAYTQPTGRDLAVIRGVGRCIALQIFSFGLWSFAWMYHTTKEVSSKVKQPPPSPGLRAFLYVIPIVNLIMWFMAWQDIEEYTKRAGSRDFPMVVFWVLTFIFGIVGVYTLPTVQSRMNDAHRAATNGQATEAPMEAIDWVFLVIGLLFWVLWVLIIVIAIAAGSN